VVAVLVQPRRRGRADSSWSRWSSC
jgi:hypothetical protein